MLDDVAPVQWRVVRTVRPKYRCRSARRSSDRGGPVPVKAIARGKASFAHVVVSNFDHHLPLYRQVEMMAAWGLDIVRSTLAELGDTGRASARPYRQSHPGRGYQGQQDPCRSRGCADADAGQRQDGPSEPLGLCHR